MIQMKILKSWVNLESTGDKVVRYDELEKEYTQEEKDKEEMEVYDIQEEIEVMVNLEVKKKDREYRRES